ncbi:MAG: hypothetical protein C5B49_06255, partial [Bdellovibrio sp.]
PSVRRAEALSESPVITINHNQYFFQDRLYGYEELKAMLLARKDLFNKHKAIVEASKETPYSMIHPIMAIMSELEVESIQLAVASQEQL